MLVQFEKKLAKGSLILKERFKLSIKYNHL